MTLTFNADININNSDFKILSELLIQYKYHPIAHDSIIAPNLINIFEINDQIKGTVFIFDISQLFKYIYSFDDSGKIHFKYMLFFIYLKLLDYSVFKFLFYFDFIFRKFNLQKISSNGFFCDDITLFNERTINLFNFLINSDSIQIFNNLIYYSYKYSQNIKILKLR